MREARAWVVKLHEQLVKADEDHMFHKLSLSQYADEITHPTSLRHFGEFEVFLCCYLFHADIYVWSLQSDSRSGHGNVTRILDLRDLIVEDLGEDFEQLSDTVCVTKVVVAHVNKSTPTVRLTNEQIKNGFNINHYMHVNSAFAPLWFLNGSGGSSSSLISSSSSVASSSLSSSTSSSTSSSPSSSSSGERVRGGVGGGARGRGGAAKPGNGGARKH
jgi:hypothetical protein